MEDEPIPFPQCVLGATVVKIEEQNGWRILDFDNGLSVHVPDEMGLVIVHNQPN